MSNNQLYFFLTFLIVIVSGNPAAFLLLGREVTYVFVLAILLFVGYHAKIRLNKRDTYIFLVFLFILVVHIVTFGGLAINASIGFLVMLVIAMLTVRIVPNFLQYYVSVMYALSLLSLVFFIPDFWGVDLRSIFSVFRMPLPWPEFHIGVHNFRQEHGTSLKRNMGFFWEPGAFAGYLILALFMLFIESKKQLISATKIGIIILALLSTQSSTGFIAFFLLVGFYIFRSIVELKLGLLRFPAFVLLLIVLMFGISKTFNNFSFLGEKIHGQMENAIEGGRGNEITRFGNFLYDIRFIIERPVFGWGVNPEIRIWYHKEVAEFISGQGNGLTGFAIKFGLLGLCIFIFVVAQMVWSLSGSILALLLSIILVSILLTGEQFLNFPMFMALMFLEKNKLKPV